MFQLAVAWVINVLLAESSLGVPSDCGGWWGWRIGEVTVVCDLPYLGNVLGGVKVCVGGIQLRSIGDGGSGGGGVQVLAMPAEYIIVGSGHPTFTVVVADGVVKDENLWSLLWYGMCGVAWRVRV